jgi:hypothetical protein
MEGTQFILTLLEFRRMKRLIILLLYGFWLSISLVNAQSTNATLSGGVTDPAGTFIVGAEIDIANDTTGVVYSAKTNSSGIYYLSVLPPGQYHVQVSKIGFKTLIKPDVVLNVQSALSLNFSLPVGATSESITVDAVSSSLNTNDASVSTVIDRQFVENMPLNGRSLQSLISLSPGVVQVPIPYGSSSGYSGEFSVNGQRTESNYYTVDGVSANVGVGTSGIATSGASGSIPAQTALGTTQNLASIDALQEFRINTSTYSAEYGRGPGAQIALQTRSGTNIPHGTVFNYFRNDALDANNWFNDHTSPATKKTAERQNDFGGTLGGPIVIPRVYDGRNRSFFFYSYEGLRLRVPTPSITVQVPDTALRSSTPQDLQSIVDAFPIPNGQLVPGIAGAAYFTGAYSLPAGIDTNSIRLDHGIGSKTQLFAHYSDSSSDTNSRYIYDLAQLMSQSMVDRSLTSGITHSFSSKFINEARYNYTWTETAAYSSIDGYGGATPSTLQTYLPKSTLPYQQFAAFLYYGTHSGFDLNATRFGQTQMNVVDKQTFIKGRHFISIGVDLRRLETTQVVNQLEVTMLYTSAAQFLTNASQTSQVISNGRPPAPIFWNISSYVQDEWSISPRNSLSLGLRWDINPPPSNGNGRIPPVLDQISNLATAKLAPEGTPLWNTYYRGFAPRIGLASRLHTADGYDTVLRAGVGSFYDTGNTLGAIGFGYLGFASKQTYSGLSFPLPGATYNPPAPSTATPYTQSVVAFDRNLKLPYTLQWNLSIEQALGKVRAFTLGYVGAAGRRLTVASFLNPSAINSDFSGGNGLYTVNNGSWSNYQSLQAKFQGQLSHGLQFLASMTWSHSIDNRSNNWINYQPLLKGDSDFDVRENFQAALTYSPNPIGSPFARHLTGGWAFDLRAFARSATPIDVYGAAYVAADGTQQYARPNLVPGVPLYVTGSRSAIPGGRKINFNAFEAVTGALGNAPRNMLRGFDANEIDFAVRREILIGEKAHIQFRAEAFNILNHPVFGAIYNTLTSGVTQFGQAYNTLNIALVNQNSLYAQGGPRSLQLAAKILF